MMVMMMMIMMMMMTTTTTTTTNVWVYWILKRPKSIVLFGLTPCGLVDIYWRCGGTFSVHLTQKLEALKIHAAGKSKVFLVHGVKSQKTVR
jgi:hypothetical protein